MSKNINDEVENQKFVNELFNKKINLGLPENQGMRDIFKQLDEMDNNLKKLMIINKNQYPLICLNQIFNIIMRLNKHNIHKNIKCKI